MPDNDVAQEETARTSAATTAGTGKSDSRKDLEAPKTSKDEKPERDEFGLPIRKARRSFAREEDGGDPVGNRGGEVKSTQNRAIGQEPNGVNGSHIGVSDAAHYGAAMQAAVLEELTSRDSNPRFENSGATSAASAEPTTPEQTRQRSHSTRQAESANALSESPLKTLPVSEYSHQQLAPQTQRVEEKGNRDEEWQEMPAYAPFDIYNDDNKLVAKEMAEEDDDAALYGGLGGAGKGYTRVQLDEDAQSATSMDDNTAYLFKDAGGSTNVANDDDDERDALSQMQATKELLTEGQRVAYVGVVRLAMAEMIKDLESVERTRSTKKQLDLSIEAMQMWSQKMMVRLYAHMDIDSSEQIMIEQLAEHGVEPADLTPALTRNARVKNPVSEEQQSSGHAAVTSPNSDDKVNSMPATPQADDFESLPEYEEHIGQDLPRVQTPSELAQTKDIDIDLRWTVLCDLFLVLIADSVYDSRSRKLLERVGDHLAVEWLELCRFEKRVTDALEMQEAANKENWNEADHMENRKKLNKNRRLIVMGLATVGGGLVIGLSAGLLAPVIGAGLAAGFTTIGVAGTSGFLAGAGGAAIITTGSVISGGVIGVKAANRRTGAVKTFEYRPLHNNKRVNLIVTVSGWMTGNVDDVRLPFSTVDPIMGDIYSVFWEPEMLRSMGQTINILATEALTQGLQQVLGMTILTALMAALQAPVLLAKLAYLLDNPWNNSLARADAAGLILADSLIDRNLGARPITLVGFSIGSRLIFSCLKELANKGAVGLIQNVYLFGSPIVANKDEYLKVRSIVPGRFVNGYTVNDWILGYLFRATSGGIMRVSGLAPIDIPGIENINCTEIVKGHMAYRTAMPRLMRECGWAVESDEFSEIEDPDPENHEKRQRELINEIEEARKALQKQPEKKKWGLFRSKKLAEKREWEMYDERTKAGEAGKGKDSATGEDVMFDIDAIQREVAEIAAQGIEVKEIKGTLPPMKLDLKSSNGSTVGGTATAGATAISTNPYSNLRSTKSYNGSPVATNGIPANSSTASLPRGTATTPRKDFEYDERDDNISMTFDTAYQPSPALSTQRSSALSSPYLQSPDPGQDPWGSKSQAHQSPHLQAPSSNPASARTSMQQERPKLEKSLTPPAPFGSSRTSGEGRRSSYSSDPHHNAWADEDEDVFGREKEMKMTFE